MQNLELIVKETAHIRWFYMSELYAFFSFWSLLNLLLKSIVTDTWLSGHQIVSAIQSTKWYLNCNWRLWKTTLSVTVSYKAVTIPIPWRPPKGQISSYDFWKLNSKGQNSMSFEIKKQKDCSKIVLKIHLLTGID